MQREAFKTAEQERVALEQRAANERAALAGEPLPFPNMWDQWDPTKIAQRQPRRTTGLVRGLPQTMSPPTPPPASPLEDYLDLLQALAEHGIESVVIGGCAVAAYARQVGETVFSNDLDLLVTQPALDRSSPKPHPSDWLSKNCLSPAVFRSPSSPGADVRSTC